jgi:antibiotic biosynthesis monooxygenase (ABM) superfamily enzyme
VNDNGVKTKGRIMQGPPKKHKFAIVIWLMIYPTITLIMYLSSGFLSKLALPLRTLFLTAILVPLMVYVLLPTAHKLFRGWLTK